MIRPMDLNGNDSCDEMSAAPLSVFSLFDACHTLHGRLLELGILVGGFHSALQPKSCESHGNMQETPRVVIRSSNMASLFNRDLPQSV